MKTATLVIGLLFVGVLNPASADILAGPITNAGNGHVYYLLTQNTWTASESEAITLGGHLAVISSKAEQDWVFSTFSSYGGVARALWIGLTDQATEGVFQWVAPECGSFTWWGNSQPDNGSGGAPQNYVHLWPPDYLPPDQTRPGFWDDYSDLDTFVGRWPLNGVVEVVPANAPPALCISTAIQVCWTTQTNATYQVQWALSMDSTNWVNLGPAVSGGGAVACIFDVVSQPQKFYRVIQKQ